MRAWVLGSPQRETKASRSMLAQPRLDLFEKLKILFAADACCSEHILDNEYGEGVVSWNDEGPKNTWLDENHVVASFAYECKTFQLKHAS